MNNTTLPESLKSQMIRYGQHKRLNINNVSPQKVSNQMREAMDSVEGSLNSLSDALKSRFRALLVSQLSLLRNREVSMDIKTPSSTENRQGLQRRFANEERNYVFSKRSNLTSVHFDESQMENTEQGVSPGKSGYIAGNKFKDDNERNLNKIDESSPKVTKVKDVYFNKMGIRKKNLKCKGKASRSPSKSPVKSSLKSQIKDKYRQTFTQNEDFRSDQSDKHMTGTTQSPQQHGRASPNRCCYSPVGYEDLAYKPLRPLYPEENQQTEITDGARNEDIMPNVSRTPSKETLFDQSYLLTTKERKPGPIGLFSLSNSDTNIKQEPGKSNVPSQEYSGTRLNQTLQQMQKKQMLNAIATLICITHESVKKMQEIDFDTEIWAAIQKNIRSLEEEVEKFNKTLKTDDILPPEITMKAAESRLKTRLQVLFSVNLGREGFFVSDATRSAVMENIELLKSSAYRFGASAQNEMFIKEMRFILKEIRNLAECFQVCGARFSKRLAKDTEGRQNEQNINFDDQVFLSTDSEGSPVDLWAYQDNSAVKKSSSMDKISHWCCRQFERLSDVQKAITILILAAILIYVIIEILTGAYARICNLVNIWNSLTLLHFGPPVV